MELNSQIVNNTIYQSPWRNVYWFARMLLNTDQFGAIGKKEKILIEIIKKIEMVLNCDALSNEEKYAVCKSTLENEIRNAFKKGTKSEVYSERFSNELVNQINNLEDIIVFIFTIRYIVLPTNDALKKIPNDDAEFCRETVKEILDTLGKTEVAKVISIWDSLGIRGCLNAERAEILYTFTKLRKNLDSLSVDHSEIEDNAILTAFVQEFERRAGQKRKSRAGNSLEDVTTFLFNYYGFSSHEKPDHFQSDIEVDKWFKCKDGWLIGISCKRTLRERWKQVSSADGNILSKYKIKEIWHLITYDRDLSDDKITMLGQQRQKFYLSDTSEKYKYASQHIGMKDYVRPLSQLIDDIAKEQGV